MILTVHVQVTRLMLKHTTVVGTQPQVSTWQVKTLVIRLTCHIHGQQAILTLNLLTTTIVAPPSNASKWHMGFNSAFKGLNTDKRVTVKHNKFYQSGQQKLHVSAVLTVLRHSIRDI